jgi:hypothetical protein
VLKEVEFDLQTAAEDFSERTLYWFSVNWSFE